MFCRVWRPEVQDKRSAGLISFGSHERIHPVFLSWLLVVAAIFKASVFTWPSAMIRLKMSLKLLMWIRGDGGINVWGWSAAHDLEGVSPAGVPCCFLCFLCHEVSSFLCQTLPPCPSCLGASQLWVECSKHWVKINLSLHYRRQVLYLKMGK